MTDESHRTLLKLARDTMRAHLSATALPPIPVLAERIDELGGAFVTIRNRKRLRGCIGRFNPETSLAETVQTMAVASLSDPRFRKCPVTPAELPHLHIEISILSRMVPVKDPLSLDPGVHGIYIRHGLCCGCFLPQVAVEQHWDRETFLSRCCSEKAGLPADAWKDPETQVYLFTSEVFEEHQA